MLLSRLFAWILSVGLMVSGTGVVSGQDFPNKPIRIVTGAAGGGADFAARLVAQGITGPLGQPVIMDNRTTFVSIDIVMKAPPDGYSLLAQGGFVWIYPLLTKAPWDPARDFAPVSLLVREVNVLAVHPSVPANSVKELIAVAKAKPGTLNYGSGVTGSPAHLAAELFKSIAGVNIVRVAYKGTAPALTALVAGEVQMTILDALLVMPQVKAGKLRALAVTTAQPSALVPGLPTMAASGVPGYESAGVTALYAPAKTPAAVINRLNQEIVRALNQADVKGKFFSAGAEVVANTPEQFAALIKSDTAKWDKLIKEVGIKAE